MVISHKYKYVFVEFCRTGSTAISAELCELYGGEKILCKHSRYHEFLKTATPEEKKYFVFSGIRNPMDMLASGYSKLKNDHKGRYTNPKEWRMNGGLITNQNLKIFRDIKDNNMSFADYFKKYYTLPYDNWSSVAHRHFDYVIFFENIQEDFAKVLQKLNIQQVRPLPVVNKTTGKENYLKYYTPDIRERSVFIFGPFMQKWGYEFPKEWGDKKASVFSKAVFNVAAILKKIYWRFTKTKTLPA
jgi:Sulfotransferase family